MCLPKYFFWKSMSDWSSFFLISKISVVNSDILINKRNKVFVINMSTLIVFFSLEFLFVYASISHKTLSHLLHALHASSSHFHRTIKQKCQLLLQLLQCDWWFFPQNFNSLLQASKLLYVLLMVLMFKNWSVEFVLMATTLWRLSRSWHPFCVMWPSCVPLSGFV